LPIEGRDVLVTETETKTKMSHQEANQSLAQYSDTGSLKVFFVGVSRNQAHIVVEMYNNVNHISETNKYIAMAKLQLCRLQPPHSGMTIVL